MKKVLLTTLTVVLLAGCATKQYPQAPALTGEESTLFDCNAVRQEIAKGHSIEHQIEETGSFDGRTVLGFLGDFGIGNGMAKSEARKKVQQRLNQLEVLQMTKCQSQ